MMCPSRRAVPAGTPHKIETPKVPAGPLGDKKQALHAAAELMGVSYPEYMELRRKKGCA